MVESFWTGVTQGEVDKRLTRSGRGFKLRLVMQVPTSEVPIAAFLTRDLRDRIVEACGTPVVSVASLGELRTRLTSDARLLVSSIDEQPELVGLLHERLATSRLLRVLLLSQYPLREPASALLNLGIVDVLRVPFSDAELTHRLMTLSERQRRGAADHGSLLLSLHDPATGRLDALRLAQAYGLSGGLMAGLLGRSRQALHKTPTAADMQEQLAHWYRIYELLLRLLGDPTTTLAWLNSPHPDLSGERPIQLMRRGEAEQVRSFVEMLYAGGPS